MEEVLRLTYASSLTDLCEINSSFDTGILRIAYHGKNRNGSEISKAAFEKCLKTIYNCPIVCNYDRETDSLGGHDVKVVRTSEGTVQFINCTTPIGCIPESAKIYWDKVTEEDGTEHEYLCAEALLWKRQEAYQKIKKDGYTNQSMEITVKDGEEVDGTYRIYDFEFTAFALIGVEPCFESASLEFSVQDFKQQLSQMMLEIKESFSNKIEPSTEDEIYSQICLTEGGKKVLNEKMELIAKYGIDTDKIAELGFSIEELTLEELEDKLKTYSENVPEVNVHADIIDEDNSAQSEFALESNVREEICRVISEETVEYEWGTTSRYLFVDYDLETGEVYCWDKTDWLLYGFACKRNGDSVAIDKETKKRKKYVIADFDEGEQPSPFEQTFVEMGDKLKSNTELEAKYQAASETIATMNEELNELREFKAVTEESIEKTKREELLSRFNDLDGIEEFNNLKEEASNFSLEELEEKCFAIRGRNISTKFSLEQTKAPKILINRQEETNKPYGDIFEKYGNETKE